MFKQKSRRINVHIRLTNSFMVVRDFSDNTNSHHKRNKQTYMRILKNVLRLAATKNLRSK